MEHGNDKPIGEPGHNLILRDGWREVWKWSADGCVSDSIDARVERLVPVAGESGGGEPGAASAALGAETKVGGAVGRGRLVSDIGSQIAAILSEILGVTHVFGRRRAPDDKPRAIAAVPSQNLTRARRGRASEAHQDFRAPLHPGG
jgi:hypothetical protein